MYFGDVPCATGTKLSFLRLYVAIKYYLCIPIRVCRVLYNLYYVKLGMFLQIFSLLGAIGLFLYGLNMLSNGLLKLSGDRLQKFLPWMKKNPVNSILSGFA